MSRKMNREVSKLDTIHPITAPDGVQQVATTSSGQSLFQDALDAALLADDIRTARCLVAEEEVRQIESIGAVHARVTAEISAAKARIAMATNDGPAAHAILLAAIEAAPENRSLRVLMSEIMLATGRASDVRPVLRHLGKTSSGNDDTVQTAGDAS